VERTALSRKIMAASGMSVLHTEVFEGILVDVTIIVAP